MDAFDKAKLDSIEVGATRGDKGDKGDPGPAGPRGMDGKDGAEMSKDEFEKRVYDFMVKHFGAPNGIMFNNNTRNIWIN